MFYNVFQYAVELGALEFNPVDKIRVPAQRTKVAESVDRRVVLNRRQARELLTAVSYVGERGRVGRGVRLVAFFACLYFAALRPSEALALREQDCHLPATGWGRLTLVDNRPQLGKRWTDSGEVHDRRGLKHRAAAEPRGVRFRRNWSACCGSTLTGSRSLRMGGCSAVSAAAWWPRRRTRGRGRRHGSWR
ncbi:hypothetical protein GCM10027290_50910 [Micromonospora sonneratiae]